MEEKLYELLKQNRKDVDNYDENGNYDPNMWWLAEDLVKFYNLHFVSKRSELLIGLLTMLEKEGGNEFIDKAEIVAKYEANL